MATLLINDVAEQELAELQALASADRMTVEDELRLAYRQYLKARGVDLEITPKAKAETEVGDSTKSAEWWLNRPLLTDRDQLEREMVAFQEELAESGATMTREEVLSAIKEGRR